jgi:hypothetical protein
MLGFDHRTAAASGGNTVVKLALNALLLLALVLLVSQCRLVTDPVAGFAGFDRSEESLNARHKICTLACDEQHRQAQDAEWIHHKELLADCAPLPWVQEKPCRIAEHDRYREAKKAIEDQKKACKQACRYAEGAGQVGR